MTTTFEKFAGATRRNYSDLPSIDVEILPDAHHCKYCSSEVDWDPKAGRHRMGQWVHLGPADDGHSASPRTRCRYCGNEDPETVKFRQHAWHDATECARCGGVDGFAIGD